MESDRKRSLTLSQNQPLEISFHLVPALTPLQIFQDGRFCPIHVSLHTPTHAPTRPKSLPGMGLSHCLFISHSSVFVAVRAVSGTPPNIRSAWPRLEPPALSQTLGFRTGSLSSARPGLSLRDRVRPPLPTLTVPWPNPQLTTWHLFLSSLLFIRSFQSVEVFWFLS